MDVVDAVLARRSVRAFLDTPVDPAVLARCLEVAQRAPSGGNLQPWHVSVVHGASMARLREGARARLADPSTFPAPEYEVYPPGLWSPYRERRFEGGEALYATLGIPREDKLGRLGQFARNWDFFGAPVGVFIHVDRRMGPPQWSDLGMYLQTLMLLLTAEGLGTCAQEAWSALWDLVNEIVDAPAEQMLFCGLAVGHVDAQAPVNTLVTERAPVSEVVSWHG